MSTPSPLSPVVGEAQASPVERFRKRPLEVEMMLWDGTEKRAEQIRAWIGTGPNARKRFYGIGQFPDSQPGYPAQLWVEHSKTWVSVHVGTRVAKEADGNGSYPVSPAAIAGTFDPAPEPLELTPPEQAAVAKSPHMSTCHEPVCVDCAKELRQLRRYIVAIWPVIEEEATRPLKERLEAAELVCKIFGFTAAGGPETDRNKAVAQAWSDWFNAYGGTFGTHVRPADLPIAELAARRDEIRDRTLEAIRAEREDGIDSDGSPVAAALDPTPIPDGEPR